VVAGRAQARVRIGRLVRAGGRILSVRMHDVRLHLVPAGGGEPLLLAGEKAPAEWPAGAYRFLVAERLADGRATPPGRYRLRVTGAGPDGAVLSRASGLFTLE